MTIPDEIVEKAIIAANDAANEDDTDHAEIMRAALTAVLPDLTASAVTAEREVCAKIAEENWHVYNFDARDMERCKAVAATIRARSNTP